MQLPFLEDMLASGLVLLTSPEEHGFYYYMLGQGMEETARRIAACYPGSRPVLMAEERETLLEIRDAIADLEPMGYQKQLDVAARFTGLPTNPLLISAQFCLSQLEDQAKADLCRESCERLRTDGLFLWGDYFLPQTLEYMQSYRRHLRIMFPAAAEEGRELCLLEQAVQLLYDAGFTNIEIAFKRLHCALLVARK